MGNDFRIGRHVENDATDLFTDLLPDDPGHLVTVELNDGVGDINLLEGHFGLWGSEDGQRGALFERQKAERRTLLSGIIRIARTSHQRYPAMTLMRRGRAIAP